MRLMKPGRFLLRIVLALLCAHVGIRSGLGESVGELEGLVAQWVALRSQIAAEQQAWERQRLHLQRSTELLRKEAAELARDLAESQDTIAALDVQRAGLQERRDELRRILQAMQPVLDSAEEALLSIRDTLPASLGGSLHDAMGKLPETSEQASSVTTARRLQLVIAIYTELEKLHNGYHWAKEIVDAEDGRRIEVEVLYIGLTCAFAVSPEGEWAAVGRPGAAGWTWEPRPALGPQVREAIDVLHRRRTPKLVHLPLRVSTTGAGKELETVEPVLSGEAAP
jgi:hypothetical protein